MKPWSPAKREAVLRLAAAGEPYRLIAQRFNTTRPAVCGLAHRHRAAARARHRRAVVDNLRLTDEEIIAALELRLAEAARTIVEEFRAAAALGPLYRPRWRGEPRG